MRTLLIISALVISYETTSAGRFQDIPQLWKDIDNLNAKLAKSPQHLENSDLEKLFKKAVILSSGNQLADEFERLRTEAFESDDFSTIDQYVQRCAPSITVEILGESNNIGTNIKPFFMSSNPSTSAHRFFKLAQDGFYSRSDSYCALGTAHFPKWIEQTESSFQGKIDKESAAIYLERWKSAKEEQNGFFKEIAERTIKCLEVEIND